MPISLEASELILGGGSHQPFLETYIFEPTASEQSLGRLFVTVEAEAAEKGDFNIDQVISAVQREYYREPNRGVLTSFESALHQANLVLHEVAEQGNRDWMQNFHVALGVLAGSALHISVAGEALVLLYRKSNTTNVSYGLAQMPLANPLRTFSQVASGTVQPNDVLFFSTAAFDQVFPESDLRLVAQDRLAPEVSQGLEQLYKERGVKVPLAVLAVTIAMSGVGPAAVAPEPRSERLPLSAKPHIPQPRESLLVKKSVISKLVGLIGQLAAALARFIARGLSHQVTQWKAKKEAAPSESAGIMGRLKALRSPLPTWRSLPGKLWLSFKNWMGAMPVTSKVFIVLTVVLLIALGTSLVLLRQKRAEDTAIQRASELLHEGQTKQQAAATALIYNNREQAQTLLAEAEKLADEVAAMGLYTDEVSQLQKDILDQHDRVQRISRVAADTTETVGDFSSLLGDETPLGMFFVNDGLYSWQPTTNSIVKMSPAGEVNKVTDTTQGIGRFTRGVAHEADKQLVFLTTEPGVALVDTKESSVSRQDIALPAAETDVTAMAAYGSRLYLYDKASNNVYSYNKTLRGYSGQQAWILDTKQLPKDVVSLAIDGSLYTLSKDGIIKEFFKGELAEDFSVEEIGPKLAAPTKIFTTVDHKNLYVLDPSENRVVIFNKQGALLRQVFLDPLVKLTDVAVSSNEETLYLLAGTKVLKVSLVE